MHRLGRLSGRYLLLFAVVAAIAMQSAGAFTLPPGTVDYVNVSIQNAQTSATGNYLQVMIPFNALAYKSYEASNLQNIEFSYNNGTVAYSWLEGNVLSETQNTLLSSSANIVYWVRLNPSIAGSTTATNVITLDFQATANVLFTGNVVGVAPQLFAASGAPQTSYAQYDNGAKLFGFYDDFAGNTLNTQLWNPAVGGTLTISNGLKYTSDLGSDYVSDKTSFNPQLSITETYGYSADSNNNAPSMMIGTSNALNTNPQYSIEGGARSAGSYDIMQYNGALSYALLTASFTNYQVFSIYSSSANSIAQVNYGALTSPSADWSSITVGYVGLMHGATGSTGSYYAQWWRQRTAPPNYVMPTATFGAVQTPSGVSISITPSSGTYPLTALATATCTPSTDTCDIDSPLGTHLATGTGTSTYAIPIKPAGSYTFYGNDITSSATTSNSFTISKNNTVLSLTNCTTGTYLYSCTTTATIASYLNQLTGRLYKNGNLLGTTNAIITDTIANTIGTFTYTFNTLGNTNYTANSIAVAFTKYVPVNVYWANSTVTQMTAVLTSNGVNYLKPPACTNNILSGTCAGNIVYTASAALQGNIIDFGNVTVNSGVTLTENGFYVVATGIFDNLGTVTGGSNPNAPGGTGVSGNGNVGTSISTSYAGSGGGGSGGGSSQYNGGAGGNTLAAGGAGTITPTASGSPGATPAAPTLTSSLASSIFKDGPIYLASASGGAGGGGSGGAGATGGSGVYGIAIAASNVIAGNMIAAGTTGGTGSSVGGGGGGGAGSIFIWYANFYTAGAYNALGGAGGIGPSNGGGMGGNGLVMSFSSGLLPLLPATHNFTFPLKVNASTSTNTIQFNLTVKNWSMTTNAVPANKNLVQNTSISYIPAPGRPTTYLSYDILEKQQTNKVWLNLSYFVLNMATIPANALTYNSPVIQYFPNLAMITSWNAKPTSWSIKSDLPVNQHTNTTAGEIFSNANVSFLPQITVTYPFATLVLNDSNNNVGTLNQVAQTISRTSNTLLAHQIAVIKSYSENTKVTLNTNTSYTTAFEINGYSVPAKNLTALNGTDNSISIYTDQSNFNNPAITLVNTSTFSTSCPACTTYYARQNNLYNAQLTGSQYETVNIYLPLANDSSPYSVTVSSCAGLSLSQNYIDALSGPQGSQTQVQQYLIPTSPSFALYLINSHPYQFKVYNPAQALIYSSAVSTWVSPIALATPCNVTVPTVPTLTVNTSCTSTVVGANTVATCTGITTSSLLKYWSVTVNKRVSALLNTQVVNKTYNTDTFTDTYTLTGNTPNLFDAQVIAHYSFSDPINATQVYNFLLNQGAQPYQNTGLALIGILLFLSPLALAYYNKTMLILTYMAILVLGQAFVGILNVFGFTLFDITVFIVWSIMMIVLAEIKGGNNNAVP